MGTRRKMTAALAAAGASLQATPAYAGLTINANPNVDDFYNFNGSGIAAGILGVCFWALRIAGVLCLMWGIYGYITARKDGSANELTPAMAKMMFGLVFIWMPFILKAIGIVK